MQLLLITNAFLKMELVPPSLFDGQALLQRTVEPEAERLKWAGGQSGQIAVNEVKDGSRWQPSSSARHGQTQRPIRGLHPFSDTLPISWRCNNTALT